jgi:hypothetical protein
VQGTPIPIGCGQVKGAAILIDYDGFYSQPQKSPGGKGGVSGSAGKGNNQNYVYWASGRLLLGEGTISSILTIYNGSNINFIVAPSSQTLSDLNKIGIPATDISVNPYIYNQVLHSGTYSQSGDSYWAANFGSRDLTYRGMANVVIPNFGLGSSPSFPVLVFEKLWQINSDVSALGPDANIADWITAFLTNPDWGLPGFPSTALGPLTALRNYTRAIGLLMSHEMDSQTAAQSHLKSLAGPFNFAFRWTNGQLDAVPYCDQTVMGNGYSYTPNLTPIYAFTQNDLLPNQSGSASGKSYISGSRTNVFDIKNEIRISYLDRANLYNPVTIYQSNDGQITQQQ